MADAIDNNVLNYLLSAIAIGDAALTDGTATSTECVAAIRLFLWHQHLAVGKVALEEASHPNNPVAADLLHLAYMHLHEVWVQPEDQERWRRRADAFSDVHGGDRNRNDCLVLAEAELTECACLITFDRDLKKRLSSLSTIPIRTPSERWTELKIQRGTPPVWTPDPRSPLAQSAAWHWT